MSKPPYKVLLLGSGEAGIPSLQVLQRPPYRLLAVGTQPDRPAGRGGRLAPPPLKRAAEAAGVTVFESSEPSELPAIIERFSADVVVIIDFGQIIPESVWKLWPTVNIHFSLLPKYRGPSPVESQILSGEIETGVTLIQIDARIDHGPIISQRRAPLKPRMEGWALRVELADLGASLLSSDLRSYLAETLKPVPQDHSEATFTHKFSPDDLRIDWSRPAAEIDRQIRAFAPPPEDLPADPHPGRGFGGAGTTWRGKQLKLLEATPAATNDLSPGVVAADSLTVGTGDGALVVSKLQLEGKRAIPAAEFLRGYPQILGASLK